MAHPNEERLREGYAAFGRADLDALRNEYFAPEIVWHTPGRSPLAGDFRGIDEVLASFGKLFELSGGTFTTELHDVLANDEHAVALGVSRAQREGKTLESRYAHVTHFRDGKLTESWFHPEDQYAVDEFWS
jgi:ketosteroid isomerase-like protein